MKIIVHKMILKLSFSCPFFLFLLFSNIQNPVVSRPIKDLELAPNNRYLVTTVDNVDVLSDCTGTYPIFVIYILKIKCVST